MKSERRFLTFQPNLKCIQNPKNVCRNIMLRYCYKLRYPFHLKFLCCLFLQNMPNSQFKTHTSVCVSYIWLSYTIIFKAQFSKRLTIVFKHSTSYYELLVKKRKSYPFNLSCKIHLVRDPMYELGILACFDFVHLLNEIRYQ